MNRKRRQNIIESNITNKICFTFFIVQSEHSKCFYGGLMGKLKGNTPPQQNIKGALMGKGNKGNKVYVKRIIIQN